MLTAVISLEARLSTLPETNTDLLIVGAEHARDVLALCADVASIIFPTAITPPTEAEISGVTVKLVSLVSDIEAMLRGKLENPARELPGTWPLLAQSGFLSDLDLIDYMLARVAEDRLDKKLAAITGQLPVLLLDHADPNVADTAQALLAAVSLHRRAKGSSHRALRPELLHLLCWRLVAAIEVVDGFRDRRVVDNARALLADYDESATAQVAAGKLIHFIGQEYRADLADPEKAGLQLLVAYLAHRVGLDYDHVLHLMGRGSVAPLAVMLRAAGYDAVQAMTVVCFFNGSLLSSRDVGLFEQGFDSLDTATAVAEILKWSKERSRYLMFSNARKGGGR
jgi:hypothetical protein